MAPRTYTLRKRADSAAETRARVISAAASVYREGGVAAATVSAIAARADVSRGTVLHHFGDLDGLLTAVLEQAVADVRFPDRSMFDGATSDEERLRRYVDAIVRFNDRSGDWWQVFSRDIGRLPVLIEAESRFWAIVGDLQAMALGPVSADPRIGRAVGALLFPNTLWSFRHAGFDLDGTIEVLGDLVVALVSMRPAAVSARGTAGTRRLPGQEGGS